MAGSDLFRADEDGHLSGERAAGGLAASAGELCYSTMVYHTVLHSALCSSHYRDLVPPLRSAACRTPTARSSHGDRCVPCRIQPRPRARRGSPSVACAARARLAPRGCGAVHCRRGADRVGGVRRRRWTRSSSCSSRRACARRRPPRHPYPTPPCLPTHTTWRPPCGFRWFSSQGCWFSSQGCCSGFGCLPRARVVCLPTARFGRGERQLAGLVWFGLTVFFVRLLVCFPCSLVYVYEGLLRRYVVRNIDDLLLCVRQVQVPRHARTALTECAHARPTRASTAPAPAHAQRSRMRTPTRARSVPTQRIADRDAPAPARLRTQAHTCARSPRMKTRTHARTQLARARVPLQADARTYACTHAPWHANSHTLWVTRTRSLDSHATHTLSSNARVHRETSTPACTQANMRVGRPGSHRSCRRFSLQAM
jgi:hypothetical protein